MILVLFGTNPYPFHRLAAAAEKLAAASKQEIIAQTGATPPVLKGVSCFDFLTREMLRSHLQKAEFVLTQGGFGSIADAFQFKKKVIALPRKKEFAECQDGGEGQAELVEQLVATQSLLALRDPAQILEVVAQLNSFTPIFPAPSQIPTLVSELIKKFG